VVVTHIVLIWLPAKALVIEIQGGSDQQWLWPMGCQAFQPSTDSSSGTCALPVQLPRVMAGPASRWRVTLS
jgi:hypothetical protein